MVLRTVLLLGLALALASAKNPTFPTWPSSYQTEIVSDTGDGTPSETTVYIDFVNKRYRYDVDSAEGTVTELVFVPPNPSVQPTIFYIITSSICNKELVMPPTPGPPGPPPPPPVPINCTNLIYSGKTYAHNESCDTWDMVCHQGSNTVTTSYLWFGQTPVRLSSTSNHGYYIIDYYDFVAGVPPASLWDLPPICSQSNKPASETAAAARKLMKAAFARHEAFNAMVYDQRDSPVEAEADDEVGDVQTCEEIKTLTEPHFPPQEAEIVECLSWFYTSWNSTAVSGTRYGLWLIDESWCGQGPCPSVPTRLFNTTASVECLAYALNDSGFGAWQDGLTQCVAWLRAPSQSPVPQC